MIKTYTKNEIAELIEIFAGKFYGIEITVGNDPHNHEYIKGFRAGKDYMKQEILRVLE